MMYFDEFKQEVAAALKDPEEEINEDYIQLVPIDPDLEDDDIDI